MQDRNALVNVQISTESLGWICLLAIVLIVGLSILTILRRKAKDPFFASPAIYRLIVPRADGARIPCDVTFEDGRRLTEDEEDTLSYLFRKLRPDDGVEDPHAFTLRLLEAYQDDTGIYGSAYMTPVVRRFRVD